MHAYAKTDMVHTSDVDQPVRRGEENKRLFVCVSNYRGVVRGRVRPWECLRVRTNEIEVDGGQERSRKRCEARRAKESERVDWSCQFTAAGCRDAASMKFFLVVLPAP